MSFRVFHAGRIAFLVGGQIGVDELNKPIQVLGGDLELFDQQLREMP
jgi:hypothetical protein